MIVLASGRNRVKNVFLVSLTATWTLPHPVNALSLKSTSCNNDINNMDAAEKIPLDEPCDLGV